MTRTKEQEREYRRRYRQRFAPIKPDKCQLCFQPIQQPARGRRVYCGKDCARRASAIRNAPMSGGVGINLSVELCNQLAELKRQLFFAQQKVKESRAEVMQIEEVIREWREKYLTP